MRCLCGGLVAWSYAHSHTVQGKFESRNRKAVTMFRAQSVVALIFAVSEGNALANPEVLDVTNQFADSAIVPELIKTYCLIAMRAK
jgi:hypothetical protein